MKYLSLFLSSYYFLHFSTKEKNYCWRIVRKSFSENLVALVSKIVNDLESAGLSEIILIKIEKI